MRQSLPDLALELSMDGIILHQRTSPGQWAELGATRIDAPNLAANLRAMRDMADSARGQDFRTQIWLPDEQVSAHKLLLTGETQKEREQGAIDALSAITPHSGEDFSIVLGAPSVSGHTPIAAVLLQTLKEAHEFAEDNGFRPVGFSSRLAPTGFEFTPAFSEPLDFSPLKRKLSFVAGMGLAFLVGGIGFRIADPYQFWVPPPQVVAAPLAMPEPAPDFKPQDFAQIPEADPVRPALHPGHEPPVASAPNPAPVFAPTAEQAGALVAVPVLSAPDTPPQLAEVQPGLIEPAQPVKVPQALVVAMNDRLPEEDSPRLQQTLREAVAPTTAPETGVQIATIAPSEPATAPPQKVAAFETLSPKTLPGPAVTRAFPLDNLETIIATAELFARAEGARRLIAGEPEPESRLVGIAARPSGTQPQLPKLAALLSVPNRSAAAMPDIGQIASLRPLRRPSGRPAALKTEGEFERAVAGQEIEPPPPLALVIPPDPGGQLDTLSAQDTPPQTPLTEMAGLSTPPSEAANPTSAPPVQEVLALAARPGAQLLSIPAPGDAIATTGKPADPVAGTETDADLALGAPATVPVEADPPAEGQSAQPAGAKPGELTAPPPKEPEDAFAGYADKRPRSRPDSVQQLADKNNLVPTKFALLSSPPPKERPATLELKAAAVLRTAALTDGNSESAEAQDEPESTGTVFASIPTSASVQRAATVENAIDRSKLSLIGVYGTPSKRRALIRLPSGRFVRVETGDKFGGYQVASISSSSVKLLRSGRSQTLKMPK